MKGRGSIVAGMTFALASMAPAQFTAQWIAQTDIVAEWVNAPAGTPNARFVHPAGPAVNVDLQVAAGVPPNGARFQLQTLGPTATELGRWSIDTWAWATVPDIVSTSADLLLRLTGPASGVVSLDLVLEASGDLPAPTGMQVDVGNDGSIEMESRYIDTTNIHRRSSFVWDCATGPLAMRVLHAHTGNHPPQGYRLLVSAKPWSGLADSTGDDCGNFARSLQQQGLLTNFHLAALPPRSAAELLHLRGTGIGAYHGFLVSPVGAASPFTPPAQFTGPCETLTQVLFVEPGLPTASFGLQATEWVASVPLLPPGFEFHVQHATYVAFTFFGVTNRVRVRT